ncbi:sigma 54-interacting transcriptional regulator [Dyadobacter chenwenxiniae]|uniref:Sigma 54-interacting transcriptional regulator n=1 Tax=Dyadobacter chenwenxiniae TaxID=2906456 RepID=A0A9X1TFF1_9BACT|nr:sigma 54-interacting transcriptional regulator [Dyadobacter chenwenxiniae]MCF0062559.1 sigma 54-interacting transcriptional regulator [Dyadobacter chenwenxiniae]UON83697.1 sigma 54-interacting transcriptional regulator [Dyadobacter chenwenxiniae]
MNSFSSSRLRINRDHAGCSLCIVLVDNADQLEEAKGIVHAWSAGQQKSIVVIFDTCLCKAALVWELLFQGASYVYDFENTPFLNKVIEEQIGRWQTVESLLQTSFVRENLLGESQAWKSTIREMIEVAAFSQSSVLIIGESGTGKEMLSKLVHHFDTRKNKGELVLLDCSAIAPELSGSEFFGHEKGAFTGAHNVREGAFSLADQGTLFLDEIGELPARLQSELLRVIQEGMYKPVGGNYWKKTNFRLVGATNRTLHEEVSAGHFRLDLFYRLSTWVCKVPCLAERQEDIPLLVERFLHRFFGRADIPRIDESVMEYLIDRQYRGNVRELQQVVQRIANRHVGSGPITLSDIPSLDRPECRQSQANYSTYSGYERAIQNILDQGCNLDDIKKLTSQIAIDLAIKSENGSINKAAERLGITTRAIQYNKQK